MARTFVPYSCQRCFGVALLVVGAFIGSAGGSLASEVKAFRSSEAADFLKGTLDGTSVGPLGKLRLASALERVGTVEEPFLLSAVGDGQGGWIVGTGNSGKVMQIAPDGTATELFATQEPEVFAVWVDGTTVYAGGSPGARIYRYQPDAGVTMVLDTEEQYVWAIGRERAKVGSSEQASGRLLIATGTSGKLIAFDELSGDTETVYDSDDVHLRTMLVRDADVLVGTVGEGRILKLKPETRDQAWSARTLYDAAQPEITSLTPGPSGSFFAAAVASEASLAQLAPPTSGDNAAAVQATPPAGTRPSKFEGARSVVLEVAADGSVETRGSFDKETVYSVLWQPKPASGAADGKGDLWIATGQDGKLYRSEGTEVVLERDLEQLQLIQLLEHPQGLSIATTNGAALYRTSEERVVRGEFLSKVLDTKFPSRFGTLHAEANIPPGARIEFAVRSGLSAFPDDTWASWEALVPSTRTASAGTSLPDFDLSKVPRGRYLQWRAVLQAGSSDRSDELELSVVELSYSQENRTPEITKLEVLAPGVILVNGSFNPSNQVFEPTSPNRDGIFNSLDKPAEEKTGSKELWKLGYRTVKWDAADPNGDKLEYTLSLRPEAPTGEARWYTIAEKITKTSWGFDSTVLPDGLYRVRVRASDRLDNQLGQERGAERLSGLVVIDHSPPTITVQPGTRRTTPSTLVVDVHDALSPLRKIELSRNAGTWEELRSADGMVDARRETVEIDLSGSRGAEQRGNDEGEGAPLLLLRVQDAAFNSAVIRIEQP